MTTEQTTESVIKRAPVRLPGALTNKMSVSTGFAPKDFDSLFVVITGRPGSGKSSLIASNPRSILFDLECNAGAVIDPQATRVELNQHSTSPAQDLRDSVASIISSYRSDRALQDAVKTISFDSFDRLVDIFQKDLCRQHKLEDVGDYKGGHGKGYFRVRDELFDMFEQCRQVGLGICLTSHLGPKDIKGANGQVVNTITTLAVSESYRKFLVQRRDVMFRVECIQRRTKTRMKSGVVIEELSKDPSEKDYILLTDTSTTADDFDCPKSPLPIESGLVLPAKGSWGALREAYAKAVDKRRSEIGQ